MPTFDDHDLVKHLPEEAFKLLTENRLNVAAKPPGALSIVDDAAQPVLWFSDDLDLTEETADLTARTALLGPWESVIWLDLGRDAATTLLAVTLFNILTGGTEAGGAEIVPSNGSWALVSGPDGEEEVLPKGQPLYFCASGGGDVSATAEEEYKALLAEFQ